VRLAAARRAIFVGSSKSEGDRLDIQCADTGKRAGNL
jgi:hypothetical protein